MTKKPGIPAKRHEFRGEMKTVAEIAAIMDLSTATIYHRMKRGRSIQERESPSSAKTYTFAGKTMKISAWAKTIGINEGTLRDRLHYSWPLELALTQPAMTIAQQHERRRNAKIIRRIEASIREEANR